MKTRTMFQALRHIAESDKLRSGYLLNGAFVLNLLYAVVKLGSGIWLRSFWFGALGVYYAVLAGMRLSLLRSFREDDPDGGQAAYRRTGWRLLILTLTMAGVFVQMVISGQSFSYPGLLIYAMAVYAFVKLIVAVKGLISRIKEENRVFAAARCVSFACALMSMLALQTALIHQFGSSRTFGFAMNSMTGAAILLLLIGLSCVMLRTSRNDQHMAPKRMT